MKETNKYDRLVALLKCLMAAYILTGILLMITAFLLYKFDLSQKSVEIAIICIYVISTVILGVLYPKGATKRCFVWGMLSGLVYFLIIVILSYFLDPEYIFIPSQFITTLLICTGSGTLGGMLG